MVVRSVTASLVRAGHLGRTWSLEPRSVCGEPPSFPGSLEMARGCRLVITCKGSPLTNEYRNLIWFVTLPPQPMDIDLTPGLTIIVFLVLASRRG